MLMLVATVIGAGYVITSDAALSFTPLRQCAPVLINRPERADLDRLLTGDSDVCWQLDAETSR